MTKSLQITVPYKTCPFKCPFCIANNPKVMASFEDKTNEREYWERFAALVKKYSNLVITGDTEPTLNVKWVNKVARIAKKYNPKINVEIQTKNFNPLTIDMISENNNIDVYSFSVDSVAQVKRVSNLKVPNGKIKRLTVLLNSDLDLSDVNVQESFQQITIKVLQKGDNEEINKWIETHSYSDSKGLENFMKRHENLSIMFDENCMLSENRYQIFRENGKVYNTWTEL